MVARCVRTLPRTWRQGSWRPLHVKRNGAASDALASYLLECYVSWKNLLLISMHIFWDTHLWESLALPAQKPCYQTLEPISGIPSLVLICDETLYCASIKPISVIKQSNFILTLYKLITRERPQQGAHRSPFGENLTEATPAVWPRSVWRRR